MTINELALAFLKHAETCYVNDGQPTSEVDCDRLATRRLLELYGDTPAADFDHLALRAVRQKMIVDNGNLCRKSINQAVCRIRSIYRWGVSHEMIAATIPNAIEVIEPLKKESTEAREPVKRWPVADTAIAKVKKLVPQRTAVGRRCNSLQP